jgi:hypothetical protein
MMHRLSTLPIALAFVASALPAQGRTVDPNKPNVVLIVTDDVGYGDFVTAQRQVFTA